MDNSLDYKFNNTGICENLVVYDNKIIAIYRDKMNTERNNILKSYAEKTKLKGDMFYICDRSDTNENEYYLRNYNSPNCEYIKMLASELPKGSELGSVLRKNGDSFVLDTFSTRIVGSEINSMIKEKINEQNEFLSNRRVEGHIYEVGEKYNGRIWLYDINNIEGGGILGIEEIAFPEDLYDKAKEGDVFIYKNGEYCEIEGEIDKEKIKKESYEIYKRKKSFLKNISLEGKEVLWIENGFASIFENGKNKGIPLSKMQEVLPRTKNR